MTAVQMEVLSYIQHVNISVVHTTLHHPSLYDIFKYC